jgi:hypothetical protein
MDKYRIPNRVKQPSKCCIHCGKNFIKKEKLDNHLTICELVHNSKKLANLTSMEQRKEIIVPPSPEKMYEMILGLCEKVIKMEEKLEEKTKEMDKYVGKQKKKINILEWLNTHQNCNTTFDEFLNKTVQNTEEDNVFLLENTFNDTLILLLTRYYSNTSHANNIPFYTFTQRPNIFYMYTNEHTWKEMPKDKFKDFMITLYLKIMKNFCEWKNTKINEIKKNDAFAIKCDKTLSKLMSVNYSEDATLKKIQYMIYQKIKIDVMPLMGGSSNDD